MEISKFLDTENIPFFKIWYFISDKDGKKTPTNEKNNIKFDEIPARKSKPNPRPKSYFKKSKNPEKKYDEIMLSETELKTLQESYSILIKYTDTHYCIDIDDEEIHNMEDFIEKSGCDTFRLSPWIKGNTKGIHIYVKINNMVKYSDQQDVYLNFKGDLIKTNNMWERIDKKVNNYEDKIEAFDFEDIKQIFNEKMNQKPKSDVKEKKMKNPIPDQNEEPETEVNVIENLDNKNEIELYIKLGIQYKIFQKMKGHTTWRNLGFILKTEMGDSGEDLFIDLSKQYEKYAGDNDVREFYHTLLNTHLPDEKKPLSLATLVKYFKDADKDIAKIIIKEVKTHINPKEKKSSIYEKDDDKGYEFEVNKLTHFDSSYFNGFKSAYSIQKQYIEYFISKVLRPEPQYIYLEDDNTDIGKKSCIFSESNINTAFRHLITRIQVGDDEVKDVPFTGLWLKDPNIKCFNKLDFIPYNGFEAEQKNNKVYNLFTGYNPKILSIYTKDNQEKILKPFIDLGLELCGGNMNHFEYFMKFMGHMIQKPNERIPICFIIKGKQGTGKNVFLNAIGSIVGKEHYITSANPKDFFGDYAEGFYHKLLVNMNECEGKDTFDFEGKIKSFITEDTITINPKNVRPSQIRNVARVIIFTNKPNPIPIDVKSSDRRYCVFQTTDHHLDKKYGTKFWTKLIDHFNKCEFIACLYDHLNNIDINVDWRAERPITEAYKEMCKLYVPVEALFFESFVESYRGCMITLNDLDTPVDGEDDDSNKDNVWEEEQEPRNKNVYDEYVKFCKTNGFSNDKTFQPSISKFNNRCSELEIPHKIIKSNGTNEFRFTPKEVYNHILKKKWINRDIDDVEVVIEDVGGEDFEFEV